MNGIHKRYHDIIVKMLITRLKPELGPKVCQTIRQMTGNDTSKVPDIYLENTSQSLDFTC